MINWSLGLCLLTAYKFLGPTMIILFGLTHGLFTEFTKYNMAVVLAGFSLLLFGNITTLFMSVLLGAFLLLLNYDYVLRTFNVIKKTMNNMIKITNVANTTNMTRDDIQSLKSMKDNVEWCEEKYTKIQNKYTHAKSEIMNLADVFYKSILFEDVEFIITNSDMFLQCVVMNMFDIFEMIVLCAESVPLIKLCTTNVKTYYGSSNLIYNSYNEQANTQILDNTVKPDVISQLEDMNKMFDMISPALNNMNLNNMNLNNSMPSESDMMKIFQSIGKITKQENNTKNLLKKKKSNII